ncbi:MAG: hypothetical protein GXO00_03445 [Candidatus Diapherotrites archaeon]|nr:hypothetical protein [Candidatus Diapherotrites archaeon]
MESAGQLAGFIEKVKDPEEPYIVLLAGASSSGKSTEARRLVNELDRRGLPLVRLEGKPYAIPMDMFYREESKEQSELLGTNFDHPVELDVPLLESVLDALVEGQEVYIPLYDFKSASRKGKMGPLVPDENPVIVVEGLYSIGLLMHRSSLNVFVETRSRLELFARRILRDVERHGKEMERVVNLTLTAMSMWNIYGESQRHFADIVLRSTYSIIEDRGTPSYQMKVPESVFEEKMPSTARSLFESPAERVEDLIVGEGDERMRGRLFFDGVLPSRFEISYIALYPDDLPFMKSLKVELPSQIYTAFVKVAQIMGYRPRVIYREIHFLSKGDTLFKWYPEKGMVEIESSSEKTIENFVKRFRGFIRLQSYYAREDLF